MEQYLPAVCYYPTTVLLIDDNRRFLESVQMELDWDKAFYRTFDDPQKALNFLTSEYHSDPFTYRSISRPIEEMLEHKTIDIDVRKIHLEAGNPERFSEISVVLLDYAMPGLTGLELCEKLHDEPYKKILLTCEADENLAVRAFNNGLIDKFIRKDDPNFAKIVNNAIHDLQKKYFHDLSQIISNGLLADFEQPSKFLIDPVFISFFEDLIQKLDVIEYYLMDSLGSFMFLDAKGKPKWLVVKNEKEMQALAEFAASENVAKEIITPLIERKKIPYFHTDEELQTPPQKWGDSMHKAQKLQGRDAYYYAVITDAKAYSIQSDILSFYDYRKKQIR